MKLNGNKTYITGIVAILGAASAFLSGEIMLSEALQLTITALIGMFLRHGVEKK